jgi:hypothetical protein
MPVFFPPADGAALQDFYTYSPGLLTASQVLLSINARRALAFAANAFDLELDAPATSTSVYSVLYNGTSVGTLTVAASASSATVATTAFNMAIGDKLRVTAPATPDATAAGAALSATGMR